MSRLYFIMVFKNSSALFVCFFYLVCNYHNCMHVHYYLMQHWSKLRCQEGEPCPMERSSHAAVCLGYGGDHPHLLVTGGVDKNDTVLSDAWILDLQSLRWREVRVNHVRTTFTVYTLIQALVP